MAIIRYPKIKEVPYNSVESYLWRPTQIEEDGLIYIWTNAYRCDGNIIIAEYHCWE